MSVNRPISFRPGLEALDDRVLPSARFLLGGHRIHVGPLFAASRPVLSFSNRMRVRPFVSSTYVPGSGYVNGHYVPGAFSGPQAGDVLGSQGVGETPAPLPSDYVPGSGYYNGQYLPGAITGPQAGDLLGGQDGSTFTPGFFDTIGSDYSGDSGD
jgi:hypothetical protein